MPEITSRLCDSCTNIPIRWLLESPKHGYTLFYRFPDLIESEKSCDFCKLIRGSIESFNGLSLIHIAVAPQFLIIEVTNEYEFKHSLLRLCTVPGSEAVSMGIDVGFPILPEIGGELHSNLLREWLRDCNETHSDHGTACNTDNELPTRVLDVGNAEDPKRLHLYHPDRSEGGECERGKYIALSHCWGQSELLRTTEASIEAHCKAIKFDDLPKTFQDAVVVTRKLGIQFLWIDSLCIIQGDADDWSREAERMEKVFALAYCTIAASSASDSTEGFLIPRPVKQAVRLVDNVYVCEVGGNFSDDVGNAVLNKRGWVLQERALSPRTIHFTTTQMYWECGSVIRCENLIQIAKPSDPLSSSRFPMISSGSPGGVASAFERIFASYSERSLTKLKDRPYAIAGLERRLMDLYKTKTTFGIVHCCLGRSLLWQRCGEERMKMIDDRSVEIVPSWSWMKYNGKIHYGNVPKINTSWNRNITLTSTDGPNGQKRCVLEVPLVRSLRGCHIEPCPDTNCKIKDGEGRLVGWIKFDNKDEVDVGGLGCIVIAEHKSNGWVELGQDTWKSFGDISWEEEKLKLSNLSCVLLVTRPSEQGYRVEVCRRLGVAVIQGECLLFREPSEIVWVI